MKIFQFIDTQYVYNLNFVLGTPPMRNLSVGKLNFGVVVPYVFSDYMQFMNCINRYCIGKFDVTYISYVKEAITQFVSGAWHSKIISQNYLRDFAVINIDINEEFRKMILSILSKILEYNVEL